MAVLLFSPALAENSVVVVRDNPDVYIFEPVPFDCSPRDEGYASLDLIGTVVEEVNGKEIPLPGVKFSVERSGGFAYYINQRIIFLSNSNGQFFARLFVTARLIIRGDTPGRVCYTQRSKLRIEKNGYKTMFLWFDYEMPEVKIIMTKKAAQSPD